MEQRQTAWENHSSPSASSTPAASPSPLESATVAPSGPWPVGQDARIAVVSGSNPYRVLNSSLRCSRPASREGDGCTSTGSAPRVAGGRCRGKALLTEVIDRLRSGLPDGLEELATLGRTLHRRRDDVLAYFDHRASNGPTEAINGRLEALRRNALGFRNLINYRIRSLLHCGALAL